MKVKETLCNDFKGNYHGILDHDGCLKVAKAKTTGKILHIEKNNILVKSRLKSFTCEIHKDLYPVMDFVEIGDTAFIKFTRGKAWFVGFQKKNFDKSEQDPSGDKPVSENMDWISFFKDMELE